MPVGHYTLQASATGFASFEEKNIAIDANDALRIDIRLRVAAGAETVQVEANSLHIETTSNQIGNVIGSSTLLALPLDGRSYTDLLGLQAGVAPASAGTVSIGFIPGLNVGAQEVGNLSINGARESDNGFIVNGGRVEDPFTNGTSVIPNLDSIQEFRLLTSNFDAEYGYFGGGIVNVVTKAGTNDYTATCFSSRAIRTWMRITSSARTEASSRSINQAVHWAALSSAISCSFSPTTREPLRILAQPQD